MSKSLGNGIDPLEVIDQVGADALRFMLCTGNTPGNDMRFIPGRLENSRNFANKLWNASRFTIMNLVGEDDQFLPMADQETAVLRDEDKWMLTRVNQAVKYITDALDKFELGLAAQRVYDLIWNEYCDWYIELIKSRLYGTDEEDKKTARFVLQKVLKDLLKLLHPFMPFITEEIYGYLPKDPATKDNPNSLLIRAQWPVYDPEMDYGEAVNRIETAMEIIKAVRNIRAEADAAPGRKLTMEIRTSALADVIPEIQSYIRNMANITDIKVIPADATAADDAMTAAVKDAEILIPLQDLVDFDEEIKRLEKEQARLQSEVERVEKKLANKGFVNKAPEKVVQEEREKGEKYRDMLETVEKRLSVMKKQAEK